MVFGYIGKSFNANESLTSGGAGKSPLVTSTMSAYLFTLPHKVFTFIFTRVQNSVQICFTRQRILIFLLDDYLPVRKIPFEQ